MKIRFPLYGQFLAILVVNLLVLFLLPFIFFSTRSGLGWEALVYSPVGERVEAIAWLIRRQAQAAPESDWDKILAEFGKFYGVKFYIFDAQGKQVAGQRVVLPNAVLLKLARQHTQPPLPASLAPTAGKLPQGPGLLAPWGLHALAAAHRRFILRTSDPDCFWIGVRFPLRPRAQGPGTLLAASPNLWHTKLFLDFGHFFAGLALVLLLSLIIWWPFAFRITRALAELTGAAEKIAQGKFDIRLKASGGDEIGRLSESVNRMAEQLNTLVTGQKRFLGDIAHELCSPISRLQVALELLESANGASRQSTIKDIREDVEEMSNLVNELLAFSKAGIGGGSKERELVPVELEPLLAATIARTCPGSSVTLDVSQSLSALGDPLMLERAVANVLRNAARYAGQDGPISVSAAPAGKDVVITITDCGPGVPPEAIKLLGEPFFRPEPSRSRSSGGVGLGLAIVKTCIEGCQGTLSLRNHEPRGLQVEIRLKACGKVEALK